MKSRISEAFARCEREGRAALMPFITCGYPSLEEFGTVISCLRRSGADLIEVGFPHSDPLADGPVIQRASHLSLERGFTVDGGLSAIAAVTTDIPIVVMCYTNLILRNGVDRFVKRCSASHISGLIVPDLILEESAAVRLACAKHGLALIPLVTPTTPPLRAAQIAKTAAGFIYFVSVTGTTGARTSLHRELRSQVLRLRRQTSLPVAVGFGISTPAMVAEVSTFSSGVIIGSKVLQLIDEAGSDKDYSTLATFLMEARMRTEVRT
jgi:tryptophan synthase alpha chain